MKFFRRLFKEDKKATNEIENNIPKDNIDFTDSMFFDIEEMKLKLENIKTEPEIYETLKALIDDFEKYIEKSSKMMEERAIEDKLNAIKQSNIILELEPNPAIPQSIKDRVAHELTIEEYYKNIKAVYEARYKSAMQNILMKKVESLIKRLDVSLEDVDVIKENMEYSDLIEYFNILESKKEEFTGIMQNKYIERLIELQYRIDIIVLFILYFKSGSRYFENMTAFIEKSKTSKSKEIIWSRLFRTDVQKFISKYNNEYTLCLSENFNKKNLEEINEKILTREIIEKYLKAVAETITQNNEIKRKQEESEEQRKKQEQEIEKQRKEQEQKEKELEEFRKISLDEIEKEIKKIDDQNLDTVTSYINIINYQIKIARAKGLINDRNLLIISDIELLEISRRDIPIIFKNMEKHICNFEIYTDIDDSRKDDVYVAVPKSDNLNSLKKCPSVKYDLLGYIDYKKRETYCHDIMTKQFYSLFITTINERYYKYLRIEDYNRSDIFYNFNDKELVRDLVRKFIDKFEKENKENKEKIKFYIEIPYRRTIIPILEELNKNEIEFTIPPITNKKKKNKPTVKIYMDRKDLDKYKNEVHKNISTAEKGIITIGEEEVDLEKMLTDGCKIPYLKKDEKQK